MPKTPTDEFASASATSHPEPATAPTLVEGSFFGHPRGLETLFFTEMWERFSYYGMRALLVLFMTAPVAAGGLGFDVARAGAIYGLYTASVYLATLPGGWVADRLIGQQRAVLYGGMVIAAGHFSMAVESLTTFYLGLFLIVIGTGLLKPNVSTMVGELYPGTDAEASARRDAGFTIFYMGINLGAFVAPLVTGFLGEKIDWHLGFGAAGVGMVLGLIQYWLGARYLGDAGAEPDEHEPAVLRRNWRNLGIGVALVVAIAAAGYVARVDVGKVIEWMGYLITGLGLAYIGGVLLFAGLEPVEKKRVAVIGVLFLAAAVFWAGFEQAGSSLNLITEQLTDRVVVGWEIPASWFQSLNALFILTLAPLFAWFWIALARRRAEPSSPAKFAIGLVLLGAGFGVMIVATSLAAQGMQISPMWLVVTYFLHTCGELTLSPVGLSTITKLAPHRMVGQMMGIWFLAASLGNLFAGLLASRIGAAEGLDAGIVSPQATLEVFTTFTAVCVGAGILLFLFVRPIRGWMGGVR